MESFNRGEHVTAAFLDVEKAFDNVWHSGLRYKIYQLDLPTKLCRWLSDFLVGRDIQVKIECFLSPKVYPKAGTPQGSNSSPLLFLIYVNDMPNPTHHQTNKSQFADYAGQWAVSKNIDLAAEYLQRDLDKLARWCAKWRIKLNPEKTKVIIFSKSRSAIRAEPALSLYGDLLSYYPHILSSAEALRQHRRKHVKRKSGASAQCAVLGTKVAVLGMCNNNNGTDSRRRICAVIHMSL